MTRQVEPKHYTGQAARRADLLARCKSPGKAEGCAEEQRGLNRNASKETARILARPIEGRTTLAFTVPMTNLRIIRLPGGKGVSVRRFEKYFEPEKKKARRGSSEISYQEGRFCVERNIVWRMLALCYDVSTMLERFSNLI